MKLSKLSILSIAVIFCSGAALADDDLNLGGQYNTVTLNENGTAVSVGSGPIMPSTLDGNTLAWVYCVGLFTDVYVPDDYPDSIVTNNGVADGSLINNAGEIAWLLDTYAGAAVGNTTLEDALQVAIWTVEYDSPTASGPGAGETPVTGTPGQGYYSQYESDLAAVGFGTSSPNTASLASVNWLTPETSPTGAPTSYQALVAPLIAGQTDVSPVPEPTSVLLFGTMVLLIVSALKRKKFGAGR